MRALTVALAIKAALAVLAESFKLILSAKVAWAKRALLVALASFDERQSSYSFYKYVAPFGLRKKSWPCLSVLFSCFV